MVAHHQDKWEHTLSTSRTFNIDSEYGIWMPEDSVQWIVDNGHPMVIHWRTLKIHCSHSFALQFTSPEEIGGHTTDILPNTLNNLNSFVVLYFTSFFIIFYRFDLFFSTSFYLLCPFYTGQWLHYHHWLYHTINIGLWVTFSCDMVRLLNLLSFWLTILWQLSIVNVFFSRMHLGGMGRKRARTMGAITHFRWIDLQFH